MLKKLKFFAAILLLVSSNLAVAQISNLTLKDQWDKDHSIDNNTQWLVFSQSMDGGDWVKNTFKKEGIKEPKKHNMIYVANISGMPALISRLFALPKMRDYAFPIALVRDNNTVASWPKEQDALMVYKLKNLKIVEQKALKNQAEFASLLTGQIVK